MTKVEMSMRMNDQQLDIMRAAITAAKEIKCFELNGVTFQGELGRVAMEYAYNNPTGGDFYVWCQDNCQIIK